ncbi:MAG TPA: hypothetical protein VJG90_08805 [Candidatus Nanoarchaeia archaeon]|nr:hypothetical protein [Candidatus Nanoarchaeia archaeon]
MSLHYQQGNQIGADLKFTPESPLVKLLARRPEAYIYAGIQETPIGSCVVVEAFLPRQRKVFVAGRISLSQALSLSHQLQDDRQIRTSQGLVTPHLAESNPESYGITHTLKYALGVPVILGLVINGLKTPPPIRTPREGLESQL